MNEIIISLHIPKTGGSTFRAIAEKVYGDKCIWIKRTPSLEEIRDIVYKKNLHNINFIHGHMLYGLHELLPNNVQYKYITFLRNPFHRLLSLYNFSIHTDQGTSKVYEDSHEPVVNISFCDWFKLYNVAEKDNGMTRIIANFGETLLDKYDKIDVVDNIVYQIAQENLSKFFFIGLTENYYFSLNALATMLHWKNIPDQKSIYSYPNRKKLSELTKKEISLIAKSQYYDISLWEYGKKLNTNFLNNIEFNPNLYKISMPKYRKKYYNIKNIKADYIAK